jgi:hypothetical protein
MIVRVQGSGQYRLAERDIAELQSIDHKLVDAVHAQDEVQVHALLDEMIDLVKTKGTPVGIDELVSSDTVLPHDTITVEEVQALLEHESLVGTAKTAG